MKRNIVITFMILSVILSCIPFVHGATNDKWALIIGYGGDLSGAVFDAKEFYNVLKSRYGFSGTNMILLTNKEATRTNVINALNWILENEGPSSTVVFFFSGHGGYGAMCLYDSTYYTSELNSTWRDLESNKSVFIIQSCYSAQSLPYITANNRIVMGSSTSVSVDMKTNSLFGRWFIDRAIKHGLGDINGDGVVSMEEAWNYGHLGEMIDNYEGDMIL